MQRWGHSFSNYLVTMKERPGKSQTLAPRLQSHHQHPLTSELHVMLEKTPQDLLEPPLVEFSVTCSQMHPSKLHRPRTQSQPLKPSSLGSPPGPFPFQLMSGQVSLPVTVPHLGNETDHGLSLTEPV